MIKDSKKHPGEKLVMAFAEYTNTYFATEAMDRLQVRWCEGGGGGWVGLGAAGIGGAGIGGAECNGRVHSPRSSFDVAQPPNPTSLPSPLY